MLNTDSLSNLVGGLNVSLGRVSSQMTRVRPSLNLYALCYVKGLARALTQLYRKFVINFRGLVTLA